MTPKQPANENQSWDFLMAGGEKKLTVSVWGSRKRDYVSDSPVTIENDPAIVYLAGCFDKEENLFNKAFSQYLKPEEYHPSD